MRGPVNAPGVTGLELEAVKNAAMPKTGGDFAGAVSASSTGQASDSYLLRNSKLSADEETPTVEGQICWQYE